VKQVKKREQYLSRLIADNVGQKTGVLDKKGFPASLFEAEANLA
jgi:hypothetical protein